MKRAVLPSDLIGALAREAKIAVIRGEESTGALDLQLGFHIDQKYKLLARPLGEIMDELVGQLWAMREELNKSSATRESFETGGTFVGTFGRAEQEEAPPISDPDEDPFLF